MKSETPPTPTPAPAPAAPTTWAIDPALQQLSTTPAQAYYAGYSYYPYQQQQQIQQQVQAQQQQQQRPASSTATTSNAQNTAAATGSTSKSGGGGGGLDTSDLATLNDALGSAGVDLRAEEESLHKSHDTQQPYRTFQDRTRTQPPTPSFSTHFLSTTIRTLSTETHKLSKPPSDDTINYIALALRARLTDLIKSMISASHHRTDTSFDRPASLYEGTDTPMWSIIVRRDVAKQLSALEKVEREEELKTRRDRKERNDMAAAQLAALQASSSGGTLSTAYPSSDSLSAFDDDGFDNPAKKKRKKEGPGVAAKNMSEDVRKQMSNLVANQASGLGKKYSWMTASNANVASRSKLADKGGAAASSPVTTTPRSAWSKPYISTNPKGPGSQDPKGGEEEEDTRLKITMRDAMFVIEKERGHGGGRGAALGWT